MGEGHAAENHATTCRVAVVQAAAVFLDREATVAKGVDLIGEAAANGARIVAFPEVWIPGYPLWIYGAAGWGDERVHNEETIIYADLDLDHIIREQYAMDVVGHYNRPDIFSVTVNASPHPPISWLGDTRKPAAPAPAEGTDLDVGPSAASVLNAIAAHRGLAATGPEMSLLAAAIAENERLLAIVDTISCEPGDDPSTFVAALRRHGKSDGR